MGLDELTADVEAAYGDLGEEVSVELDAETRNELAIDRKSTRLNSSHIQKSRMPSSA